MGTGIIICGLNGSGKSTLGKALAERLHFYFIDNEDLYFPKPDPIYIYAAPRTREEVKNLFFNEIKAHENFVFLGGDLYEQEQRFFDLVKSRAEDTVEKWVQSLNCPIIRIDGTKPIEENINLIIEQIKS